jgi:N-acetyl-gamma-glutamyl-phosphate reductase
VAGCGAVLLATPAEASLELAPKILGSGLKIIDLSGAFRLKDAAAYPAHYGFSHTHPDLLARAVYGLPELGNREEIKKAQLVANPGCYATASALALAPLLGKGLLVDEPLIINAASGVTGAGRKATEDFSFTEIDGDFRAYRVLRHQHTPEISQTCSRARGQAVTLTFVPHLLPFKRGILCTVYAHLAKGKDPAALPQAFRDACGGEPFLQVMESPDQVSIKGVVGTNRCQVGVAHDGSGADKGRVVVTSSIDNLVKGAAGQAVQNLNLMLGMEEGLGLEGLKGFHP